MTHAAPTDTTSVVIQGGAATLAVAFLRNTLDLAFPFLVVAGVVIIVDLIFGVKAAAQRGEVVRASKAIRRTIGKAVEYLSWVILGATLAIAFEWPPLSKIIIGVAISIELLSIVSNWLSLHGKKISGLEEFAKEVIKDKTGHDASMIHITDAEQQPADRAADAGKAPETPGETR